MSEELTPIVKGEYWDRDLVQQDMSHQLSYCLGQHDLVAAGYKDMSHYRRRSPQEKPDNFEEYFWVCYHEIVFICKMEQRDADIIVWSEKDTWEDSTISCKLNEVDWWAYAWLPNEEGVTGKTKSY